MAMGLGVNIFTFGWSEVGARRGRLRVIEMFHLADTCSPSFPGFLKA
jgi:hypothetical protein